MTVKPFLQPDRTVSRHHWYLVFRSHDGTEEQVFAFPRTLLIQRCIDAATELLGEGWYHHDLNDPTYEQQGTGRTA